MDAESLKKYAEKRDFDTTPEPEGTPGEARADHLGFVVQKHDARRMHFDFRLELDGVYKSWAVPKGPSYDPSEKRLAVHVEDHPLEYGRFEGTIPKGEYGGGTVLLWDNGWWEPQGDPRKQYRKGHLTFVLHGHRLKGSWTLARMGSHTDDTKENWLLIKHQDTLSHRGSPQPVQTETVSITTRRTLEEIARDTPPKNNSEASLSDVGNLPGAIRAPFPNRLLPEKATFSQTPPSGAGWIHEIKYDGYRIIARIQKNGILLTTRNGKDWTEKFISVKKSLERLFGHEVILDGEVAVQSPDGRTDFQALQNVLSGVHSGKLVYFVFDLVYLDGIDLQKVPLTDRKEALRKLCEQEYTPNDAVHYGNHLEEDGALVYEQACRLGLEGIVSKRKTSRYYQGRSREWLKTKCVHRQEFVIGGYSEPSGKRARFGALLLGYYESGRRLVYCGRVGTGFDEPTLDRVGARLELLQQTSSPFATDVDQPRGVHWVAPVAVAEIEFRGWTDTDRLRQPSFKGLRDDKDPLTVGRETAIRPSNTYGQQSSSPIDRPRNSQRSKRGIVMPKLTHPEKVLYEEQGVTKQDLIDYYTMVADRMLPLVKGRPLALVRCPDGRHHQCFYQKHLGDQAPPEIRTVAIQEKSQKRMYAVIDDLPGLWALVQISCLELHTWNVRRDRLERPDMMIFDLDPGPGVPLGRIIDGARQVRSRLRSLGIESFVKSSGGKGLHVVVPLVRSPGWDEVKRFAQALAQSLARENPREFVATMAKDKRSGKIFVDYVRNSRGHTTIAPYSTRARKGAPVSVPLSWDELDQLTQPDQFSVPTMHQRLAQPDPWEAFASSAQTIRKAALNELGL